MTLFLASFFLVLGLMHGYVFLKARAAFPFGPGTGVPVALAMLCMVLAIVLLFGVWGAIGIALGNPFLFLSEFGQQPAGEIILNSLIAGFVPLVAARGAQRLLGIDRNITKGLRVGVGYNFTDFSDNLTDFSYRHHGWFLNVVGSY